MSSGYTRDHLKIATVKILHTLGWNSVNTAPLEVLTDILGNYLTQLIKSTNSYANEFGCTEPNLDHLGLSFRDMGISITALSEYVKYVNFGPPPSGVPLYPIPKESHLNFLKPGSQEVVTRAVNIHEHLPPMNPLMEGAKTEESNSTMQIILEANDESGESSQLADSPAQESKKAGISGGSCRRAERGSRPTREISSVIMTTSGFLSPAREGKLPEAKTPVQAVEMPAAFSDVELEKPVEKPKRPVKVEKKRSKVAPPNPVKVAPPHPVKVAPTLPERDHPEEATKPGETSKMNSALMAARLKTEKLNTTITPVTVTPEKTAAVTKLLTEPDKKKIDIIRKISNVRNERSDLKKDDIKSEGSSPDLVIDEVEVTPMKVPRVAVSGDVTIEPVRNVHMSPKIEPPYFDDDSHSGPPSTPKTPELISHSPPFAKEKRKRKEKKAKRTYRERSSPPHQLDNFPVDMDMERPKTPEPAQHVLQKFEMGGVFPFGARQPPLMAPMHFPFHFGGPGLIPTPFANPLFPPMNFPPIDMQNLPAKFPPKFEPQPQTSHNAPATDVKIPPDKTTCTIKEEIGSVATTITSLKPDKKTKEEKKEKRDKIKKRNKKEKDKNREEKKKIKGIKELVKKEKKEKRRDKEMKDNEYGMKITLKIKSPSPPPIASETRKLNIKPIVKTEPETSVAEPESRQERESSPDLAKISALVVGPPKPKPTTFAVPPPAEDTVYEDTHIATIPKAGPGPGRPRLHPNKSKSASKPKILRSSVTKDSEGNEVWICPACSRQDDGSPMIGCDGCDAWYHWVCVGIQVPPDEREDWYCRYCLLKKNEDLQSDKQKKRRKKKEKKEHH